MAVNNPKFLILHCSDVSEKTLFNQLASIDSYHKSRGFPKSSLNYFVGYHYLITGGRIYQTRLDSDEGAHCNQVVDGQSINYQSIGICWAGDGDIELPSDVHYNLIKSKTLEIQAKYNIPDNMVKFHRYFST